MVSEPFTNLQPKYFNILGVRKVFGYLVEKKALDIWWKKVFGYLVEKRSLDIWWVSRLAIYNPGVLQGEQGAHQPLLFLNKQGDNFENKTQHRITLDS